MNVYMILIEGDDQYKAIDTIYMNKEKAQKALKKLNENQSLRQFLSFKIKSYEIKEE